MGIRRKDLKALAEQVAKRGFGWAGPTKERWATAIHEALQKAYDAGQEDERDAWMESDIY